MDGLPNTRSPGRYGTNASYVYEYSRGTKGLDIPRDILFTRIVVIFIASTALIVFWRPNYTIIPCLSPSNQFRSSKRKATSILEH